MDILKSFFEVFATQIISKIEVTNPWGASVGLLLLVFSIFLIHSSITFANGKEPLAKKNEEIMTMSETASHSASNHYTPSTELAAASSSQQNTQTCVGGNCLKGNNYGSVVMNQYGASKLLMTEEQKSEITKAMRPFSGLKFTITRHDATPDSSDYAEKLREALKDAGMICVRDFIGHVYSRAPIQPSVSFAIGNNEKDAVTALANIMVKLNLIPREVNVSVNPERPDAFDIIVAPNR